ncbi:hypothetical protein GCM10010885_22490 [Alicyclobacillus cellulosilyticus]|uniref:Uncharacterized protein n=1 Tax=Alicyclobacillus cellulosilyticus TaxID=1003997 RepID=A0A917NMY3_9BACL|nr:Wadjet anti-phage system protein JetA family protein [Alicyclobacillus cellulosilyticus]GGJ12616.1 hypothetical protein GCM10010885_22490 [Alicyclobacillus cellulosilyticus]
MRDLFEVVPHNLFSLLASRQRAVYFRALMVLWNCYQREIRFRRGDLVTYLISEMERDLAGWSDDSEALDDPFADGDVRETESGRADTVQREAFSLPHANARVPWVDGGSSNAGLPDAGAAGEGLTESGGLDADMPDAGTLSGKAHALIRRLVATGWLQAIPDETGFDETLIVPRYASVLLDALYRIVHPAEQRYNAIVYSVYSNLRTANEERDEFMLQALQSAHDHTIALRESLRALLHNIHTYYQNLHLRQEIRELLAEHFDSYQVAVAIAMYHPLKTFDSVYRFRPRVLQILRDWLASPSLLQQMAASLLGQRPDLTPEDARAEVVQRIQFIADTFESLDDLLQEIDRRNAHYSRASVDRLQYLLNTDRDVKGKLVQLLRALPPLTADVHHPLLEAMRELPLFQVRYADPDALYREPRRRQRGRPQPLRRPAGADDAAFAAEARELVERANAIFSPQRIAAFIREQMGDRARLPASALRLRELDDFLRTMVAVVRSDEPEMPYEIDWTDADGGEDKPDLVRVGDYGVPQITFVRKEG